MRIDRKLDRPAARHVTQRPRHPEVYQENATAFESNNQILAATVERRDALTLKFTADLERVERPHDARVADLDVRERPPDERRLESAADGLDLGKFGHAATASGSAGRGCRAKAPCRRAKR
jgi:hypothetical protein